MQRRDLSVAIYGTNVATPTSVTRRVGPRGNGLSIAAFSDFIPRAPAAGEPWFEDRIAPFNGDGTVPIDSSAGLFFGDPRVTLAPFAQGGNTSGSVSHLALMFNRDVQQLILDTLGAAFRPSDISTSLHQSDAESLWSGRNIINTAALVALLDPVDGFGFALGGFTAPLEFVVAGLGEGHYAGMGAFSKSGMGQVIDAGLLGNGESRTTPAVLTPLGPECDNGIDDACDNCLDASNWDQLDRGGLSVSNTPDGIGDACQCGDVSGDGRVTVSDAVIIRRALLSPPTATIQPVCVPDDGSQTNF